MSAGLWESKSLSTARLADLASRWAQLLSDLDAARLQWPSGAARRRIHDACGPAPALPELSVASLVLQQTQRSPRSTALTWQGRGFSFQTLLAAAARVAEKLRRAQAFSRLGLMVEKAGLKE